ncbi:hypothetical protein PIB30_067887, partial [Stylosanthes scabra]|nr:hypothetical protein [Stylosanthes scabra]
IRYDKERQIEDPTAIRSSFLTDFTISSTTSQPKRQRDLPCMRATAYRHLFASGASSQGVVRQTNHPRICISYAQELCFQSGRTSRGVRQLF